MIKPQHKGASNSWGAIALIVGILGIGGPIVFDMVYEMYKNSPMLHQKPAAYVFSDVPAPSAASDGVPPTASTRQTLSQGDRN